MNNTGLTVPASSPGKMVLSIQQGPSSNGIEHPTGTFQPALVAFNGVTPHMLT
jgi:hypothetical protein